MASILDKLLAADISDSTDFPNSEAAPGLRAFDEALRCDICRDFYDAPVTLSCGHCFCSACIRSALPEQQSCPTCRKPASDTHIRKDVAMENAVHAWRVARPLILRLSREEEARKTQVAQPPKPSRDSAVPSERVSNKRRRLESPTADSDDEVVMIPSSSPAPATSSAPSDALPRLVPCPICEKNVPSQTINKHIDSDCKRFLAVVGHSGVSVGESSKSKQKQQWNRLFDGGVAGASGSEKDRDRSTGRGKGKARATPAPDSPDALEHLPKVAYDIHKSRRIADMLAEHGLPTHGEKSTLVKRHKRWVVLYNANVDRAPEHRRTLDQLRQELRKAEDAEQNARARKETVDDPVAYQKANKDAFAQLTEAARPKKPSKVSPQPQQPQAEASTHSVADEGERESSPAAAERQASEQVEVESTASTYDVIDVDDES